MTVSATGSSTGTSTTSLVDQKTLIGNYETFLTLLTTQLKYQSPLDPMDSNQFTQQLVQYSQVEQSIKTNTYMEQMIAATKAQNASSLVGYLGTQITADGATTALKDGQAAWYVTASGAGTANVTIKNSAGVTVYQEQMTMNSGANVISWDGKVNGVDSPSGNYTISVDLKDSAGKALTASSKIAGKVTSLDMSGDETLLYIGDIAIPMSKVTSVRATS